MKYLIDTDIASYFLRGKHNLAGIFESKGVQNLRLSVITLAELKVLALKNPQSAINLSRINQMAKAFNVIFISGDEPWQLYSKIKAETLQQGRPRGDLDILQAALAKQHSLIVVTNNLSHFQDIVETETWI